MGMTALEQAVLDKIKQEMSHQWKIESESLREKIVEKAKSQILNSSLSAEIKAAQIDQLRKDLNR